MALLLNFTVCVPSRFSCKTVVPWTIKVVNPPNSTYSQFFESVELSSTDQPRLNQTYVGKAKDRLDLVDAGLVIADVAPMFGPYTKFVLRERDDRVSLTSGRPFNIMIASYFKYNVAMLLNSSLPPPSTKILYVTPIDTSAIAVLMQGARDLWHPNKPSLPAKVSDVRNKKHQLKNDLLSFMEEKELSGLRRKFLMWVKFLSNHL